MKVIRKDLAINHRLHPRRGEPPLHDQPIRSQAFVPPVAQFTIHVAFVADSNGTQLVERYVRFQATQRIDRPLDKRHSFLYANFALDGS